MGNSEKEQVLRARNLFPEDAFPLRVDWHELSRPIAFHSHDFTELVVVLSGRGQHQTENGSYSIGGGEVFVINGPRAHGYGDCKDLRVVNVLFNMERLAVPLEELRYLAGYHALFSIEPAKRRRHAFESRLKLGPDGLVMVEGWLEQLKRELTAREEGYRFMAMGTFMHLVCYLSRCYGKDASHRSRDILRMAEILVWLEENREQEVRVSDLARRAHLSERSFQRAFREATGCSPINYLTRLRLAEGAELLRKSTLSLSEIAWKVGMKDANFFSRQFRKYMGMAPGAYRIREYRS